MERNINHMNHTNSITGTKADQVVLSFEKLKALRERKLTTEEADFSEEHLSIVWWFLNEKKLPADDWFDVVVLRYLLTVKRWSTLPELRRYSFTIGCVCHEICRQHRETQAEPTSTNNKLGCAVQRYIWRSAG